MSNMGMQRCLVNGILGRFWHRDLESGVATLAGSQNCFSVHSGSFFLRVRWPALSLCCEKGLPHSPASLTFYRSSSLEKESQLVFCPLCLNSKCIEKGTLAWIRWLSLPQPTVAWRPEHITQDGCLEGGRWSGHCEFGKCSKVFLWVGSLKLES